MIRRARAEHPELRFEVIEDEVLPFGDGTFDVVVLFAVLTCIPSDTGQTHLMAELRRVLRNGGLIHICDYPLQSDDRNRDRYRESADEFGTYGVFRLPDGGVVRHHDMAWIRSLTSQFAMVHLSEIPVRTMNGNAALAFRYFGARMPG
jgi:SAM-dependent methyltransferase